MDETVFIPIAFFLAGGLGIIAADTLGAQALAMGVVAVGLGAVTLVLFRRDMLAL